MKPIRTRLVGIAIALTAIAIAAPVATAGAAGPVAGQQATLTGATYITTAPATFTNTNNQTSPGANSMGNQVAE